MPDLESLLRASLTDHAGQVEPRPEAVRAAVDAVQRRRRARAAGHGLAAVAAVAVATTWWHPTTTPATTAPAAAPSTTAPTVASTPGTPPPPPTSTTAASSTFTASTHAGSGGGAAVLTAAFGPDYTVQPKSPSGFGGDLTLIPGSPSSAGLPAGYQATITLQVISGTSDSATGPVNTMTALCAALVEKGAMMKPCVPQTINGLTVQRAEVDAPNTKIGTWANLRILYARPDTQVQYAEITIFNTTHPTTSQERAAAVAWIHAQNANATLAATTPIN